MLASGNLTTVTDPSGNTRSFGYTGNSLVQTATDGKGNPALKNTYTATAITEQQDARALASHASYATLLSYQNQTVGGVQMVVASGTDRAGNAISVTSLQANGATIASTTALGNGQLLAIERQYDGYSNLTSETTYGRGDGLQLRQGQHHELQLRRQRQHRHARSRRSTPPMSSRSRAASTATAGTCSARPLPGTATGFGPVAQAGRSWTSVDADNTLQTATDPFGQTTGVSYLTGTIHGLPTPSPTSSET